MGAYYLVLAGSSDVRPLPTAVPTDLTLKCFLTAGELMRKQVEPLVIKADVDFYLSGHVHTYSRRWD